MNDSITDVVIPILRNLQADTSILKDDVSHLRGDVAILKESMRRVDSRLGTMDSYMSGFYGSLRNFRDELDQHRGRIEWLEEQSKPPAKPL